tara:strand:+ start:500 stop:1234 length:735 start_codon:yes stop_codon:yes gene_type:complete
MLGLGTDITSSSYVSLDLKDATTDLELWFKNGVGVTSAKWDDSSGNANHASQATESNQATVSGGGLDFESGQSDHYDLASSISIGYRGGFCMAIVVTRESTNAHAVFSDSSTEMLQFQGNTTTFRIKTNTGSSGSQDIVTDAVFPAGTFASGSKFLFLINRSIGTSNVFSFFKNGNALTADVDTSTNEATGENPNGFDFDTFGSKEGTANFFDGIIHEVAFWSKGLSTQEITDVNDYLKSVHGL